MASLAQTMARVSLLLQGLEMTQRLKKVLRLLK